MAVFGNSCTWLQQEFAQNTTVTGGYKNLEQRL